MKQDITIKDNERLFLLPFLIALMIMYSVNLSGQNADDVDFEMGEDNYRRAWVKVDGKSLFSVRGVLSYPAEQRADAIEKRILDAASDASIASDSVKVMYSEDRIRIFAGDIFIMNIYPEDGDAEGISSKILAENLQRKIIKAIENYRTDRSSPVLIRKMFYAIGALLLLFILIITILWLTRKAKILLEKRVRKRIESLENKSFNLIRSNQLWKSVIFLFNFIKISLIVVIVAGILQYILGLFPWTNNVALYTLDLFLDPIVTIGNKMISFLPSLAFLVVIFLVTRYLLKLIRLLFNGIHQNAIVIKNFDPDWAMPTFKIVRIFIMVFAVVVAYPYIPGSNTNAFKGISVFIGVLFSLGSSSFIGNVIAGYSMTYRRAFKPGDRIQVGDQVGFVEEQKLLVTRIRSLKNEEIIIPNSVLLNSNITNYSSLTNNPGLILHTTVGIGYETPWRQVDAMLKLAAERTEGLLKDPPPFVLKRSLDDFAITYEINAYCNDPSKILLYYSELHQNILDVFNENNVQIMTPAYRNDPDLPKIVPKDQWHTPLAGEK